jgi:hypothetical protein
MPIFIFDTRGGLCNQFYDINCGINFCLLHNFKFTFRYCLFRNADLISWYERNFEDLFDTKMFEKYDNYIKFETLELTDDNTYNLHDIRECRTFLTKNYLEELLKIDKPYIVLKQIHGVYKFHKIIDNVYPHILPSKKLLNLYEKIKSTLLLDTEKYNFIHYRYEIDFTSYFKIKVDILENVISNTIDKFKNPNLKIYIATSNIKNVINKESKFYDKIIMKNEDELREYNFEELAFVDYMFGLHSNEVFGHKKSSFSNMLNHLKKTSNYYS